MTDIVYLDLCCFKRPFDDASIERIRREAEAVASIMDLVSSGRIRLVRSPAHEFENERNPREDRRLATRLWLETATERTRASAAIDDRARALAALGFGPLDALHLAFAEASGTRWFVTTDDDLLRRSVRHRDDLNLKVLRPDEFPVELAGDET